MSKLDSNLFHAVAAWDTEKVKAAVAAGANLNAVNNVKESVLHYAVMLSSTEIVDVLTAMGATEDMNTLLIGVAVGGNPELTKRYLSMGANPNHEDETGTTALMYAVVHENQAVLETLMENGGDLDYKSSVHGLSASDLISRRINKA